MNATLPLVLVVATLGIGCAPQDVVVADFNDATDSGIDAPPDSAPPGCFNDTECDDGYFCKKPSCVPGSAGSCVPPHGPCGGDYNPVCGCDGTTYWNECMSERDHQQVRFNGIECPNGPARKCDGHGPSGGCNAPHAVCSPLGMTVATCSPQPVTGKCWVVPLNCGGTTNDVTRWNGCPDVKPCVDTCTAIRSGETYNADDGGCASP